MKRSRYELAKVIGLLWMTNFVYDYQTGPYAFHFIRPGVVAVLFCVIALFLLSRRCYRLTRHILNEGVRVPAEMRLFSWLPLLWLFPVMFSWRTVEVTTDMAGELVMLRQGIGSGIAWLVVPLGAGVLILIQVRNALEDLHRDGAAGNVGAAEKET